MGSDCLIAADELHVSYLTLPRIPKHAFPHPAIVISVLLPGFASEEEYYWGAIRRRNSPLPLAPEGGMQVLLALVNLAHFKWNIRHICLPTEIYKENDFSGIRMWDLPRVEANQGQSAARFSELARRDYLQSDPHGLP